MKEIIEFIVQYEFYAKIIFGVLIALLAFLLRNKLSKLILKLIGKISFNNNDKAQKRDSLLSSMQKPLANLFLLIGVFGGIYLNYPKPVVVKSFKILLILLICWALVNYLSNNLFLLFHFGENADDKMNTTAIKFISNILKILVIAFAIVMVISELGYNINGLLTGIGVGGLAISLAAQEAVSNLISGFIIVLEKPFIVGDLIQTASIQGYVEEVTMRSTRIRTLEDMVVTVPNANLTKDAVINLNRMNKRQILTEIGLTYNTSNELIEKCENDIRDYLNDNEKIIPDPIRIHFKELDDFSLNIEILCYTNSVDINEYVITLNEVNLKIKEIVENNKASFAFPTSSIYIEK